MFEPFGQLFHLPRSDSSETPVGADLARAGIYLFWALVVVVVVARVAFGSRLFAFAS